ncbi:hypothetical protein A9Q99_25255 [Gammaproteobacteria bacterium 45_16_T64]|mgnify:CR=1 FL=1|nr:hypothetical protein A9Q99_25255 [Gammaproteobacteria bacterium 45_16_T64]
MNQQKLINMSLSDIKPHVRSVSRNHLLSMWVKSPESFSFERYNLCVQNIAYYLSLKNQRTIYSHTVLQRHTHNPALAKISNSFANEIAQNPNESRFDLSLQQLFLDTCSIYSQQVYGHHLTQHSPMHSSITYFDSATNLFKANVYTMLGAHIAQESQAPLQLKQLFKGYEKQRATLTHQQWLTLKSFYDTQLNENGTQHFDDMRKSLENVLDDDAKKFQFFRGYEQYLALQNKFWQSLSDAVFTLAVA